MPYRPPDLSRIYRDALLADAKVEWLCAEQALECWQLELHEGGQLDRVVVELRIEEARRARDDRLAEYEALMEKPDPV